MKLSSEQREQLRLSLLGFLEANQTRFGLSAALLRQMARSEGRSQLDAETVAAELDYLADKNFIAPVDKKISPENRAWRITADGRDFLANITGE
jgi:hypothetical protein